jgi:hypothetical protein
MKEMIKIEFGAKCRARAFLNEIVDQLVWVLKLDSFNEVLFFAKCRKIIQVVL